MVEEKKKIIISEISIYDNSELLHDSLQKKIEENDELDKQIQMHNDYILSLKEKITIIEKNYNDEKSKKNKILNSLLEKINNIEKDVTFFLDISILDYEQCNFHPLDNTKTIQVKTKDCINFLKSICEVKLMNFKTNEITIA